MSRAWPCTSWWSAGVPDNAVPRKQEQVKVSNAETRRAMAESDEIIRKGTARFASADEMFAELEEAARQ